MSWSGSGTGYSPSVAKKPSNSSMYSGTSSSVGASIGSSASNERDNIRSCPVRTTDQVDGDLVVPLVIWNEPPTVEISCLHVLYLPMAPPSQDTSALLNKWPSLASFMQQWSSQSNLHTPSSMGSLGFNSAHSMMNLPRVMSRRKSKRASLNSDQLTSLRKDFMDDEDDFQYVDDGDLDGDDELYQLCVFAGTVDGMVVYWLLEQDVVVQVSMLVHPTTTPMADDYQDELASGGSTRRRGASPVQSIVSGVDEWGQSNMISVTRDGAIARWELPNGACSRADVSLASQLAPVKGMEMFCNNRYAIVYGEQSRMMVVDTWKLLLLYCVDTSQEQVRRGVAIVELKMPSPSGIRKTTASTSSSAAGGDSPTRRASDGNGGNEPTTVSSFSNFTSDSGHMSTTGSFTSSGSSNNNGGGTNGMPPLSGGSTRASGSSIWDSLVISLGSEGLVKCFLWSKPRGGGSSASSGSVAPGNYQWAQESCWVISWADEADDITCSQSTSLKDGDNMNPQTALMRSIKSSYFPRCVHISSDASLVLFIWDFKWVVLKRKWLCDLSPPGTTTTGTNNARSGTSTRVNATASWKYGSATASKLKSSKYVGSCRISPTEFVGSTSATARKGDHQVYWENGAFLGDNQIVLWTNTGHVFQFPVCDDSLSQAGKLFIFTKDQDQLVPRSYNKNLKAIGKGKFVANMNQCECCQGDHTVATSFRTEKLRQRIGMVEQESQQQGFTSCIVTSEDGANRSLLSTASASVRLVHMCHKGSVGSWNLSTNRSSSPTRFGKSAALAGLSNYERVAFHSLADGFVAEKHNAIDPSLQTSLPDRRVTVAHLVLGREDARSSSSRADPNKSQGKRRRRIDLTSSRKRDGSTTTKSNATTSLFAGALHPVSSLLAARNGSGSTNGGDDGVTSEDIYSEYLLDVPVIVRGCTDGSIEAALLASAKESSPSNKETTVRAACHQADITAVAHSCWPTPTQAAKETSSAPGLPRLTTTGSIPDSVRKAAVPARRGALMEDSCLASERNPFYRARFPPPAQRRSMSSRHMSLHQIGGVATASPSIVPPPAPSAVSSSTVVVSDPSLQFIVFSGCSDGVLRISELRLRSAENSTFALDLTVLQRFKKHRGAIHEILISPWTRENSICPERFVATIGEDNTVNIYAPVYLQNPYSYGPGSSLSASATTSTRKISKSGIEWECVLELGEHPETIRSFEWLIDRGQVQVECDDGMIYFWSLDTGILERSVPCALVYDGGNSHHDHQLAADSDELTTLSGGGSRHLSSVESFKLAMGDSSVHLIKFNVHKSAEVIKTNWRAYYHSLLAAESLALTETHESAPSSPPSHQPRLSKKVPSSSPYAVGSIELLLLAFLLSWGATPEIDRACRELLGLESPSALFSCVLLDEPSGALSIPLPWKSVFSPLSNKPGEERNPFPRKWQHSSALSANVALGILSLCMNLMEHKYSKQDDANDTESIMLTTPSSPKNKEEFHVLWSQLITQHSVVLPDYVPFFREPSLEFLAKYGFHRNEYTQLAARALLNSSIKRLHPQARSALCAEYSAKLHCEIVQLELETSGKLNGSSSSNNIDSTVIVTRLGSLVILLSMIGTCYPGEISPAGAREVCDILVCLLRARVQHVASVAAELLTKGLMLFRPHLVDLSSLLTQLLFIDLREKQRNPGGDSPTFGSNARVLASGGSNAALSLLIELGACETAFVLTLLQQEMNNADRPHAFRECILLYLMELINTHYLLMFRHLPSVVDTIMCCLDPTKPERRKRCLELSTRCLHNLVRRFPMVDFHKETQRLAIGAMEAVILIYDLRTATKWRVLDGHMSAISAVGFRADGQILVSYAAREGSVRWWNSGNVGLFGGMLKMQQSCIKEHKLDVLKSFANAPSSSGGASADLKQVIQTCRFQFLVLKDTSSTSGGNNATGDRKVLRLTREDASQVQFLM